MIITRRRQKSSFGQSFGLPWAPFSAYHAQLLSLCKRVGRSTYLCCRIHSLSLVGWSQGPVSEMAWTSLLYQNQLNLVLPLCKRQCQQSWQQLAVSYLSGSSPFENCNLHSRTSMKSFSFCWLFHLSRLLHVVGYSFYDIVLAMFWACFDDALTSGYFFWSITENVHLDPIDYSHDH